LVLNISPNPKILRNDSKESKDSPSECFLKWWYPQTIHFNRVFHYFLHSKPSILGHYTPIFGFPPKSKLQNPWFCYTKQGRAPCFTHLRLSRAFSDDSEKHVVPPRCNGMHDVEQTKTWGNLEVAFDVTTNWTSRV